MNSDPHRLHHLFSAHTDETISPEEHAELQECLRRDPAARRLWFVHQDVDAGLQDLAHAKALMIEAPAAPSRWSFWRPLTAAAAGLVIGLFSASMVFAYAMPKSVQRVLPVANADFEEPVPPVPDSIPVRFGVWSGDYAEVVGAQQGIAPHKGSRMFRFLRSDSSRGPAGPSFNGNIYQLIDARSWREAIAGGTAVVDWSAWFNCVKEPSGSPWKFEASVWAFAGDPSFVRKNWEEKLHQELAYSSWRIAADDGPKWQRIAGSMIVPPDTDYLVIELKAFPGNETPVDGAVTFPGHYADDVQLILRTSSRPQAARPKNSRP
jgi:hypothetical protein